MEGSIKVSLARKTTTKALESLRTAINLPQQRRYDSGTLTQRREDGFNYSFSKLPSSLPSDLKPPPVTRSVSTLKVRSFTPKLIEIPLISLPPSPEKSHPYSSRATRYFSPSIKKRLGNPLGRPQTPKVGLRSPLVLTYSGPKLLQPSKNLKVMNVTRRLESLRSRQSVFSPYKEPKESEKKLARVVLDCKFYDY
jgi:hypothetical protein